jgi:oligopeptide/dipeptide ABC transporter ATP-binding protein
MTAPAAFPAALPAALDIAGLLVRYGAVLAVRDVSLVVPPGEVLALIGETGSGKSSLALAAARLLPPSAEATGQVRIAGQDLDALPPRELRRRRASLVGYVAQDAMAALNPVQPVGWQIGELFRVHRGMARATAAAEATAELARVRIDRPELVARRFPHQLSGGMRQRVMIAMAVAMAPPLLIADEPTTALDVSTQAEILALAAGLREETGAGILWITHDMGVVAELADSVAVMYAGRIVEQGPVHGLFDHPCHPYTEGLLRTRRDLRTGRPGDLLYQIEGSPPVPTTAACRAGCPFAPRCPRRTAVCDEREPALAEVAPGRLAACHHAVVPPAERPPQSARRAPRQAGPAPGGIPGPAGHQAAGRAP